MDLWVLDDNRNKLGLIDTYSSLIWTKRYYTMGDFELVVPATTENLEMLQCGNFVTRGVGDMLCRIESADIKTDPQNGDWLIVKGRDGRSILNQRVNLIEDYDETYTAEDVIDKLIEYSIGTSTDSPARRIGYVDTEYDVTAVEYPSIVPYKQVFDHIAEICQFCDYGSEMVLDDDELTLVFRVYEGTDRSLSQSTNDPIVFTEELDNLGASEYTENYADYKNSCYITGDETSGRQLAVINLGSGINRYEMYVDGKGVQKNSLTTTQYENALKQFGVEAMQSHHVVVTFTGEVLDNTYHYGTDYFLGDIVTIYNKLGMAYDARITQVIESDDTQNGHLYIPTFEVRRATILEEKAQAILGVNGVFYFYYGAQVAEGDNFKGTVADDVYDIPTSVSSTSDIPWYFPENYRSDITAIEIDSTFAQVQLTTLAHFFHNLRYVASVTGLQYLDLSQCISMEYAFSYCGHSASTFSIDVSPLDVSQVQTFAHCFEYVGYNATALTLNGFGAWDVSSARYMAYMFAYAGYEIPVGTHFGFETNNMLDGWDTSQVRDMTSMFDRFAKLGAYHLNLSYWNVNNVALHTNFNRDVETLITPPQWRS